MFLFQNKKMVAEGLSSLVNICQAVHFPGFEEAKVIGLYRGTVHLSDHFSNDHEVKI